MLPHMTLSAMQVYLYTSWCTPLFITVDHAGNYDITDLLCPQIEDSLRLTRLDTMVALL